MTSNGAGGAGMSGLWSSQGLSASRRVAVTLPIVGMFVAGSTFSEPTRITTCCVGNTGAHPASRFSVTERSPPFQPGVANCE